MASSSGRWKVQTADVDPPRGLSAAGSLLRRPRRGGGARSCSQKPADQARCMTMALKAGQRAVGIALADRQPDAVAQARRHPQAGRHKGGPGSGTPARRRRPPAPPAAAPSAAASASRGASECSWRGRGRSRDTGETGRRPRRADNRPYCLVGHPDPVAGLAQPVVELGVLVVAEVSS